MTDRTTGAKLNELWGVGAEHALYIHDGHWYHQLERFPGALFDQNGYVLFQTESDFRECRYLSIGKDVSVPVPGISQIPGYFRVLDLQSRPPAIPPEEVPADTEFSEGSVIQVRVNRYERDSRARAACIRHYGAACSVCVLRLREGLRPCPQRVHPRPPSDAARFDPRALPRQPETRPSANLRELPCGRSSPGAAVRDRGGAAND
jgi:hypothetical protein